MKRAFFILLIVAGLYFLADYATDGFRLAHIYGQLEVGQNTEIPEEILNQRYTYLAKGSQSYAFVSEDNRYVIKFFRNNRWRFPLKSEKRREEGRFATMQSCHFAMEHLKEETGLIALHLSPSTTLGTLEIVDRNHIAHRIDLNQIPFVIQHFAEPVEKRLLALQNSGAIAEGKACIDKLIAHILHRFTTGLSDKDPHPVRNFGFYQGQAIEVDVGGFVRDPKKDLNYLYGHEMQKAHRKLETWLKKNFPEIVDYAKMRVEEGVCEAKRSIMDRAEPIPSNI